MKNERVGSSLSRHKVPVKDLSAQEELRLEQLEKVVVENFQTFIQVGQALTEIRERKLYRIKAMTFERYCKELFDIAKSRANQLMDAAGVVENFHNCGSFPEGSRLLPINEAQVRPLAKLNPDQQVVVWKAAVESAPKGRITASHVSRVVKDYLGDKIKKTVHKARRDVVVNCSAEFSEAFENFSNQIIKERDANYKHTARGFIVKALDQLRAELAEDGETIDDQVLRGGGDDWNKLSAAGFSLFRKDRASMTIKQRSNDTGGWTKFSGPFDTLKEMEDEFRTILQNDTHLRG